MSFEVIAFGEPLVAFYPKDGDAGNAPLFQLTWGGDTSNFSIGVTKLGHRCCYLTRVGSDEFGSGFLSLWDRFGVDTGAVQRDPSRTTGLYFVTFREGRHHLSYYRRASAATAVDRALIDWERLKQARVLHLSGISQAISSEALDLSFELMAFARRHGLLVSYDVNYRPALWPVDRARAVLLYTVGEYVDVLEITDEEMALLGFGERPEELAGQLPRRPPVCAVKLGSRGSYLQDRERALYQASFPVAVQDTVGAGDAFDAGLIAALLEGRDLEEAGRLASGTAALTCRGTGPLEAQPYRAEVEEFLRLARGKTDTPGASHPSGGSS